MALEQHAHVALGDLGLAACERFLARVDDERIVGEHVAPARPRGAQAQVVLFAVSRAESFGIEEPDVVEHRAAQVEAESDAGRQVGIHRHRRRGDGCVDGAGIRARRPRVVLAEAREREDLGVVRERRDRPDARIGRRAMHDRVEPTCAHDRVRVQEHHVGPRQLHAAIGRSGEAQVPFVPQERELRVAALRELREQRRDARIGRGVVDQDDAHVRPQVREHALDADAHVVRRVVDRDDDVDDEVRRRAHSRIFRHKARRRIHGSETHQRRLCR